MGGSKQRRGSGKDGGGDGGGDGETAVGVGDGCSVLGMSSTDADLWISPSDPAPQTASLLLNQTLRPAETLRVPSQ